MQGVLFMTIFYVHFARVMARNNENLFYRLTPLKLGCEVYDIQLKNEIPSESIEAIKKDVTKHRLLVFR